MNSRISMILAAALLTAVSTAIWADKAEKVHDGIVLSVTADLLAMTDAEGKNEHSHKVDAAAAITIDGKPAKLPELAKGDKVKVAIDADGKVVRIAAMRAAKKTN